MYTIHKIFKSIIIFFIISTANAGKQIKSEKCVPYFVSLRVNKANSHVGPGREYKNVYTYQVRYIPLLVIAKYDKWRKVIDMDNCTGWLKQSQLSTNRYVMVKNNICILYKRPDIHSDKIVKLGTQVIMKLSGIINDWCYVKIITNGKQKHEGYVQKKDVFGVLDDEK